MKRFLPLIVILSILFSMCPFAARADFEILRSPYINFADVTSASYQSNALHIKGNVNPVITVPGYGLRPERDRFLTITAKSSNPSTLIKIWWMADGIRYSYPNKWIAMRPSSGFETYTIDLAASSYWKGQITQFFITFTGLNDSLEISRISIREPHGAADYVTSGLSSFFENNGITPKAVNNVPTPYLFGRNFPALINYVFLSVTALLVLLRLSGITSNGSERQRKIATAVLIAAAILTLAHDIRTSYGEYGTHLGIKAGINKAEGKTELYSLAEIHAFSVFVKENMTDGSTGINVLPNDPRICPVQLKYWLYPIKLSSGGAASGVGAIFEDHEYAYYDGKLTQGGLSIADIEQVKVFDENSFVFKFKEAGK